MDEKAREIVRDVLTEAITNMCSEAARRVEESLQQQNEMSERIMLMIAEAALEDARKLERGEPR